MYVYTLATNASACSSLSSYCTRTSTACENSRAEGAERPETVSDTSFSHARAPCKFQERLKGPGRSWNAGRRTERERERERSSESMRVRAENRASRRTRSFLSIRYRSRPIYRSPGDEMRRRTRHALNIHIIPRHFAYLSAMIVTPARLATSETALWILSAPRAGI